MICQLNFLEMSALEKTDTRIPAIFFMLSMILISTGIETRFLLEKAYAKISTPENEVRFQLITDKNGSMRLQKLAHLDRQIIVLDQIFANHRPFHFLPIPINLSEKDLLKTVDGIGEVMAGRIVRKRTEGEITHPDTLLEIRGIGTRKLAVLKNRFSYESGQPDVDKSRLKQ